MEGKPGRENVRWTFSNVRVVAYADDVHLQGPPPSAIKAFHFLVAATAESLPLVASLRPHARPVRGTHASRERLPTPASLFFPLFHSFCRLDPA
jgi:hypothetical protein